MIRPTTVIRLKHDGSTMAGMMAIMQYHGGDLSNISNAIYELRFLEKLWYTVKCRKKITHQCVFYCEYADEKELRDKIAVISPSAIFSNFKLYQKTRIKLLLELHEVTALRLID